jgi:hypothetical protein
VAHLGSTNAIVVSPFSSSSSSLLNPKVELGSLISRCVAVNKYQRESSQSSIGNRTPIVQKTSRKGSLGILRLPRLSWFQILCRWFPLFLIFTTTTPLSLGMYKGACPGSASNILETTLGSSGSRNSQDKIDTIVNLSQDTNKLNHNSIDTATNIDDKNDKMTIPGLSDEDQKFLDRIQSSLRTVQNWDASIVLLEDCRSQIPWKDLNNATGLYSNPEQDRLLQGNANALFLQRLCRWFPKFMSWVNTPPCQVCGHKECEFKTVRGPETEEEKEGQARRVEGELQFHFG